MMSVTENIFAHKERDVPSEGQREERRLVGGREEDGASGDRGRERKR